MTSNVLQLSQLTTDLLQALIPGRPAPKLIKTEVTKNNSK